MTAANDTIGHCIDNGYSIYVCCDAVSCSNTKLLDLDKLAAKLGRDHGALRADLIGLGFRCSKCGSRDISFRASSGGTQSDYFQVGDDEPF